MIITRTPYRISLFGGGTDYPAWYRVHGGAVLATTIDKYCYLTCRYLPPFLDHRIRLVYSKIESCQTIDEINHPAARTVLQYLKVKPGIEIHHDGDLPARSGMGSSSAFTVGLLHALHALKGEMRTKCQLAKESIYVEQELLGETVGSQDQILAAYGGLNHISFFESGDFSVRPLTLSHDTVAELNSHLVLFYTGIKRTASDVAQSYVIDIESKKRQLRLMRNLVDEAISVLGNPTDISVLGELMREAWQAKRSLSEMVSNPDIDLLFEAALRAGAIGGKLTGAGGGGFLLLVVPPSKQAAVRDTLRKLVHVPFKCESSGSQIIFYDPQQSYAGNEPAPEAVAVTATL